MIFAQFYTTLPANARFFITNGSTILEMPFCRQIILRHFGILIQLCQTLADPDAAPVVFALIPSQTSGQTNGLEPHVLQVPLEMIVTIVFVYLNTLNYFVFFTLLN